MTTSRQDDGKKMGLDACRQINAGVRVFYLIKDSPIAKPASDLTLTGNAS